MMAGDAESMARAPFVQGSAAESLSRTVDIHGTIIVPRFVTRGGKQDGRVIMDGTKTFTDATPMTQINERLA